MANAMLDARHQGDCYRRVEVINDAELIARARDVVARSKTLLQEDPPKTFAGERHYPEPSKEGRLCSRQSFRLPAPEWSAAFPRKAAPGQAG